MTEKDIVYSSSIKYDGVFLFSDFYEFCYNWIMSEVEPTVFNEKNYSEKIIGNKKVVEIEWEIDKKLTDYFKYQIKVKMKVTIEKKSEIKHGGRKIRVDNGNVSVGVKSSLIKDYEDKFEGSALLKIWRSVYEKWIIQSKVEQLEGKVIGDSDEFLNQAKAYLGLEGKK